MDWLSILLALFLAINAVTWAVAAAKLKDANDWLNAIDHLMRDKHYTKGRCQVCGLEYVRDTSDDICGSCRSWRRSR